MPRDISSMHKSHRCGAQTRRKTPCRAPAVAGKSRCRMHGGAVGSGAPPQNKNALKHGLHTKENLRRVKALRDFLKVAKETLADIDGGDI